MSKVKIDTLSKEMGHEKVVVWNGVEVTITPTLSLVDAITFVDNVVDVCFQDNGEYRAEFKQFMIDKNLLELYCNFSLPEDIHECYKVVYGTDAVNFVYKNINQRQFDDLVAAANERIRIRAKANVEMLNKNMNDLINSFSVIQDKLVEIFGSVGEGDISKLLNAIEGCELDEKKLVKAYLEEKDFSDK